MTPEDDLRPQAAGLVLALHGHVVSALVQHRDTAVRPHSPPVASSTQRGCGHWPRCPPKF